MFENHEIGIADSLGVAIRCGDSVLVEDQSGDLSKVFKISYFGDSGYPAFDFIDSEEISQEANAISYAVSNGYALYCIKDKEERAKLDFNLKDENEIFTDEYYGRLATSIWAIWAKIINQHYTDEVVLLTKWILDNYCVSTFADFKEAFIEGCRPDQPLGATFSNFKVVDIRDEALFRIYAVWRGFVSLKIEIVKTDTVKENKSKTANLKYQKTEIIDETLSKVGERMAKIGKYHPDWVKLAFSIRRRDERIREVAIFEFVYGGCILPEEQKILSEGMKHFIKNGYW